MGINVSEFDLLFLVKPPYLNFYRDANFLKKAPYSLIGQIFNLIYNTV
jgi:hypothetical protein